MLTYQDLIDNSLPLRSAIKRAFGATTRNGRAEGIPVKVVNHPESGVVGDRGGFFTRGGTRISHPSAYSKKGWSNMVYHCSSRAVEVSESYVAAQFPVELFSAAARLLRARKLAGNS